MLSSNSPLVGNLLQNLFLLMDLLSDFSEFGVSVMDSLRLLNSRFHFFESFHFLVSRFFNLNFSFSQNFDKCNSLLVVDLQLPLELRNSEFLIFDSFTESDFSNHLLGDRNSKIVSCDSSLQNCGILGIEFS